MKPSGRCSEAPRSLPPQGPRTCTGHSSVMYFCEPPSLCSTVTSSGPLTGHQSLAPGHWLLAAESPRSPPSLEYSQPKGGASPGESCSAAPTTTLPGPPQWLIWGSGRGGSLCSRAPLRWGWDHRTTALLSSYLPPATPPEHLPP